MTRRSGGWRSRPLLQRLFIVVDAVLVAVSLLAGTAAAYAWWRLDQLETIELPPSTLDEQESGEPFNVLLVGSDTRAPFVDGEDRVSFGDEAAVPGQRADTMIVVRVEPDTETVALLSVPRDLWLPLATGATDRVNEAFAGGPATLIDTIQQALGVPVHHYAQVDFAGFKELVDVIGGITVSVAHPVRDHDTEGRNPTGLDIRETGCVELTGDTALAWVRARNVQEEIDGEWTEDTQGDLGRVRRQQDFLLRAVDKAVAQGFTNPFKLNQLLGIVTEHVDLSGELSHRQLFGLAQRFADLDPASVETLQLTVSFAERDGKSVVLVRGAESQPVLDRMGATAPLALPPEALAPAAADPAATGPTPGVPPPADPAADPAADRGTAPPRC